jgi:hypothetical protein
MQTFYHRLTNNTHENMDATAGGAFLSLTITQAAALVEKWPPTKDGMKNVFKPARKLEVYNNSRR